jgi:salicylate hydroxylase
MADMTPGDTVEKRLQLFEQVRLPRCATTQIMSNAMFYSHNFNKQDMVRRYYKGPLPPPDAHSWSEPLRNFFYAYNVYEESEKAMQYKDATEGVPDGVLRYFGPLHQRYKPRSML